MTDPRTTESRGTAGSDRVLATVLFTDIVGSTEKLAELGDRGWRELLREHHARVREELQRFGGREINTAGDGFLAAFDGPEAAVRCACAIRDGLKGLGMDIRCGIHTGEVVFGETAGGIAVHIGARVAAKAGPGEVLVSSTVRDLVEGSGIGFRDRGAHVLKGVPGHWRLFAVTGDSAGVRGSPVLGRLPRLARVRDSVPSRRLILGSIALALLCAAALVLLLRQRGGGPPEPTVEAAPGIAVLPFQLNDPALETWREGMVDLLSINLDGVPGLRAIDSRTVLARWHERVHGTAGADLGSTLEVARAAGARYALVGSAASIGPEVRFTAEVYDVAKGANLGLAQVQGSPNSVLGLVDRLSIEILRSFLPVNESQLSHVNLASVTTSSLPALKAFLDGEVLWRHSDFEGAIESYQRALEADSTFALAMLRLGFSFSFFNDLELTLPDPERLAQLAERLPTREALVVRVDLLLRADSLQENLRGLELLREAAGRYPDDPDIWYQLGETTFHFHEYVAAIELAESDTAFSRIVALDSTYAPAYIHLFDIAYAQADSARVAGLLQATAPLVDSLSALRDRLTFELAFGNLSSPEKAGRVLDSLPSDELAGLKWRLPHPRFRAVQAEVLSRLLERADNPAPEDARRFTFRLYWNTGKLQSALELVNDPETSPWLRSSELYTLHAWGLPVPQEMLDRELALGAAASLPDTSDPSQRRHWKVFYAGAYAAERNRWADHAEAVSRLRGYSRAHAGWGETATALSAEGMAQALEGYALWRRGQKTEALRLFESAQGLVRYQTGLGSVGFQVNRTVSWWHAELLLELGRPREAVPYLKEVFSHYSREPLPAFYLAKAYEQLNEFAKAREAYDYFAAAWLEADHELQPMVNEALRAASRLRSVIRE